jgi:hypothetical protein
MMRIVRAAMLCLLLSATLVSVADAQVLLAIGAVRQMTSDRKQGHAAGYDVATVLLDARAENVYRKAVEVLKASKDYRIARQVDSDLTLEFTDGKLRAGLQVTPVSDQVSQLVIASSPSCSKRDVSFLTVNGVLRICKEMGVHCEMANR